MIDALQDALQRPLNLASPFGARSKFRQNLADRLSPLRSAGYSVFAGFKTGLGSSVDNLAIGPPGIFVIMTSGLSLLTVSRHRLRINGLLKITTMEAKLVAKQFPSNVPVYPVICLPARYDDPEDGLLRLGEVQVSTDDALIRALNRAPAVLSEQQVLESAAVAWTRQRGH